ncbi:MAG: DUF3168 domain-containing protein [Sphingobium sp.]|uniref:tail completion protein gp17 n=1 Tax=Sphingobium sp. TaxID=1912891 RepID=UPI0029A1FFBA|nr:DUF3168 domain-containing protein [Sphingobium sp.]MDX3908421.1 DUF3168 domain-containing protein [Sphingobium sp.]
MVSASDAVEKASYATLSAGGDIGAPVFQHVPEDTDPPVIIIGDIEATPIGGKDDPDRRVALTVITVTEAEERKPLLDLMNAVETRLDGARLQENGWKLSFTFVGSSAVLTPEGDGYVGESRFEILAFAA